MPNKNDQVASPKRAIRSFVRREGRITIAQKRALNEQWKYYGLDFQTHEIDFDIIFARHAPRFLDIGFGMGESLLAQAQAHPECDFVGIEVYRTGIGCLLHQCQRLNIQNVRVICHDAVEVLQRMIPDHVFYG
jgi:tRNA (guanine-N7-)-methyltransferase